MGKINLNDYKLKNRLMSSYEYLNSSDDEGFGKALQSVQKKLSKVVSEFPIYFFPKEAISTRAHSLDFHDGWIVCRHDDSGREITQAVFLSYTAAFKYLHLQVSGRIEGSYF